MRIALIDRDTNKIADLFVSRLRVGSDLGTDLEFTSGEQLSSPTWDRKEEMQNCMFPEAMQLLG